MKFYLLSIAVALAIIVPMFHPVQAETTTARIGEKAPEFTAVDSNGIRHNLSDFAGKYIVLEWVNYECPFVRKHYDSGNMQRLQSMYTGKNVIWLSINSSAAGKQGYFDGAVLKERIVTEKSAATAYLTDSDGKVGKMYGAKTTPHMFIINKDGLLVYAGAIDDKPSSDRKTLAGADNHVEKVLNAILEGKESPLKATASYGCSVKY